MLLMLQARERNEVFRSENDGGAFGMTILEKKMQRGGFVGGTVMGGWWSLKLGASFSCMVGGYVCQDGARVFFYLCV